MHPSGGAVGPVPISKSRMESTRRGQKGCPCEVLGGGNLVVVDARVELVRHAVEQCVVPIFTFAIMSPHAKLTFSSLKSPLHPFFVHMVVVSMQSYVLFTMHGIELRCWSISMEQPRKATA